jgi:hypothetical protein
VEQELLTDGSVSSNSNTIGVISGAGTADSLRLVTEFVLLNL